MGKKEETNKDQNPSGIGNKISEFFNHLIAYGGINLEKGILYVWNNPTLFFPIESYVNFENDVKKALGDEGREIFYWVGWIGGKNSTITLMKRYGLNKNNLPEFVNGATQDGFGKYILLEVNLKKSTATIIGKNCKYSETYKKIFGISKKPMDDYISGVLAGGSEPIVGKSISSIEEECISQGKEQCLFKLSPCKKIYLSSFKKLNISQEEIEKKSLKMYATRKNRFKILKFKDFEFGDGSFKMNKHEGVIMEVYSFGIINHLLSKRLNAKKYKKIIESFAENIIKEIYSKRKMEKNIMQINEVISELNYLGLGEFRKIHSSTKSIVISNENNPLLTETKYLFGYSKSAEELSNAILKKFFNGIFKKDVKIKSEYRLKSKENFVSKYLIKF